MLFMIDIQSTAVLPFDVLSFIFQFFRRIATTFKPESKLIYL